MLLLFIIFFLLTILLSALTTIPLFIAMIVVATVIFKKPWIFFIAFLLGLFLDLFLLRPLGQTSLVLSIFILIIILYERKFETQTFTFVFFTTFLGSIVYLWLFGYQTVIVQALVGAFIGILLFKLIGKIRSTNIETRNNTK